jgi:hypothetical protein
MDWNTLKFLLACRGSGVHFTQTLTMGRQTLIVDESSVRALFQQYGALRPELDAALESGARNADGLRYVDGLFKFLGAEEVTSIDASDYEGASVIHDLNVPLPAEHVGRYDFVFDGGTLEHIFHFPTALRSCMEAVKSGGHVLIHTPTNNWCGHGFYQLSPELYYRALSNQNGFEIKRMTAVEYFPGGRWFDVVDPAVVRRRVEIAHGKHRVILLVLAQRVREAEIFKTAPQQSDFLATWNRPFPEIEQRFFARLRDAWREGRLAGAFVERCVKIIGSNAMIAAANNRRNSMRAQRHFFRPTEH